MIPHRKQYSLTPIASPIDSEIDSILTQFFTKHLSSTYWPRSVREVLERVLKIISERSDVWDMFSSCAEEPVNLEWIDRHCVLLSKKHFSSDSFPVQTRNILGAILRSFRLHRRELQLSLIPSVTLLQTAESVSPLWPEDICDITDIYSSFSGRSLRRDISTFYLHLLSSVLNNGEWKLKFLGAMKRSSGENEKLISIEVVPLQVSNFQNYLDQVSLEVKRTCANFLPNDLADVVPLLKIDSMKMNEEAFYSSSGI